MLKISSVWFHVSYILILPNHSSELIMNYLNTLTSDTQIILLFLCCQCGSMVFTAMVTMFVCHSMQLRRKSFSLFLCQNFLPCAQDVQILFNFKLNFFFFFFLPISHFISLCFTQLILLLLSQKNYQISLTKTQDLQEQSVKMLLVAQPLHWYNMSTMNSNGKILCLLSVITGRVLAV